MKHKQFFVAYNVQENSLKNFLGENWFNQFLIKRSIHVEKCRFHLSLLSVKTLIDSFRGRKGR